jgi:hypothetical protein
MNDDTHLYLAIDNPNDSTQEDNDQMGVYFDDNPLPSDGQWTNTTCGNPDGEGNFWVYQSAVIYREWIAGPLTCTLVEPAPGTAGAVGHGSGHAQSEIAIDLSSSALRAAPGDAIHMYLWIYNAGTETYDGQWPSSANFLDPSTYGSLTLADDPGGDSYEPDNTWEQANRIYDGSPQEHSIVPVGDADWVRFSLGRESEVVLETSGPSGDTRMWLYDSKLNQLEYDDDDGVDLFSYIDRACGADALPAGTYYVNIDEWGNNQEIPLYYLEFTVTGTCQGDFRIYLPVVRRD